jgi:hypothetical protein
MAMPSLTVESTIQFLSSLADKLDGWAETSLSGGWSTHQVEANRSAADDCRREAARLRQMARDVSR